MPIPTNRSELLLAIESSYRLLRVEIISIPAKYYTIKSMEGHKKETLMSPSDLLAYLIGWGELVLQWDEDIRQNKTVIFPHPDYKWTELGDLAQYFYQKYQEENRDAHLKELDEVVLKIISLIEQSTDAELYGIHWYKTYSRGRMIQLNSSSPYKNARARLRKWKKQQNVT